MNAPYGQHSPTRMLPLGNKMVDKFPWGCVSIGRHLAQFDNQMFP